MITVELLTPIRVTTLRPFLAPLLDRVVDAHETARLELTAEQLLRNAETGLCHMFAFTEGATIISVLAIQFYLAVGVVHANLTAFAGAKMARCIQLYWPAVCDWMAASGAKSVVTNTTPQMARVLSRFTKFAQESVGVRMRLGEQL